MNLLLLCRISSKEVIIVIALSLVAKAYKMCRSTISRNNIHKSPTLKNIDLTLYHNLPTVKYIIPRTLHAIA